MTVAPASRQSPCGGLPPAGVAFLSVCFLIFLSAIDLGYHPHWRAGIRGPTPPLKGTPAGRHSFARFFREGRYTKNRAAGAAKNIMKTDKNSSTHTTSGAQPNPESTIPDTNHNDGRLKTPARISYERWLEKYRPIPNPLDLNATFDGRMFETYGAELEFVCAQSPSTIWTLVECDGKIRICQGLHFVNRLGYFVTEIAANKDRYFSIKAD